jgi:DNA segregation ATPase FtsK/SpoIIIE-like protein
VKKSKKIDPIIKKLVLEKYGEDNELYELAKDYFSNEEFVSTGSLQRVLKISYIRAQYILDRMINEGFCGEQIGAWPCKVLAQKN